jgi:hypothetical protein
MAYNYSLLVTSTVIPKIREYGVDVTLTRNISVGALWERKYDPVNLEIYWENLNTGATTTTEPVDMQQTYTSKCVVTDFTEEEKQNTSILMGDKKLLTIELPTPKQNDVYTVRGVDYKYVNHETIAPGDTDVLYKIQVRV